jgi:hypothetical protein
MIRRSPAYRDALNNLRLRLRHTLKPGEDKMKKIKWGRGGKAGRSAE